MLTYRVILAVLCLWFFYQKLDAQEIRYNKHGLPLLQSKPGAPVALYLDFNGGVYRGKKYSGYSEDEDLKNYNAEEQKKIIETFNDVRKHWDQFDVNLTTMSRVRKFSKAWGWILISNDWDEWGGRGIIGAIGRRKEAGSIAGKRAVMPNSHGYLITHELGHNFGLYHVGKWIDGKFYKWEDVPNQTANFGYIMGGYHLDFETYEWGNMPNSENETQDAIRIINDVIYGVKDPSNDNAVCEDEHVR